MLLYLPTNPLPRLKTAEHSLTYHFYIIYILAYLFLISSHCHINEFRIKNYLLFDSLLCQGRLLIFLRCNFSYEKNEVMEKSKQEKRNSSPIN